MTYQKGAAVNKKNVLGIFFLKGKSWILEFQGEGLLDCLSGSFDQLQNVDE